MNPDGPVSLPELGRGPGSAPGLITAICVLVIVQSAGAVLYSLLVAASIGVTGLAILLPVTGVTVVLPISQLSGLVRRRRNARVLTTVGVSLFALFRLPFVFYGGLGYLVLFLLPLVEIILLWAPRSSREHFRSQSVLLSGARGWQPPPFSQSAMPAGHEPSPRAPQPQIAHIPSMSGPSSAWSLIEDFPAFPDDTVGRPRATRAAPLFEVVGVAAGERKARSTNLDLTYDQQSWFPVPTAGEFVHGAFLVSILMRQATGGSDELVFQGSSTLLVTDRRLAGVCPKGMWSGRRLNATAGPVVLWSVPNGGFDRVIVGASPSGPHMSIGRTGGNQSWLLVARPRVVDSGGFRAADIRELADVVRRAT